MEQYRSSLAPRTQRRSQNIHFDAAKIGIVIRKNLCIFALEHWQYSLSGGAGVTFVEIKEALCSSCD